jgi:hypothetical protein
MRVLFLFVAEADGLQSGFGACAGPPHNRKMTRFGTR